MCTITTDGTTPAATAYIVIKQTAGTARTFYIDGVQIEAASSATGFKETGLSFNGLINSPTTFRNQTDSTTAFQIQNAAGSNFLVVDTLNNSVLLRTPANSTTAFQIQNSSAVSLFTADTSNLTITIAGNTTTFATLVLDNAHFKSSQTNAPTIGTPSNCGTTPTAAIGTGSTDSAGSFRITAGTGGPGQCEVVITFNKAYGAAPKSITIAPQTKDGGTGTAAARQATILTSTTTTFTVKFYSAPADSEVNWFYYWVIE
jgi:hypothetical protein